MVARVLALLRPTLRKDGSRGQCISMSCPITSPAMAIGHNGLSLITR